MTKVSWFGCARSGCRGPLAMPRGAIADGTARCRACGAMFPVLAGVPILVPAPAHWMAAHRDAILATLVEHDAATPRAVAVVDAFADAARDAEPARFGDDWVADEDAAFALALPPGERALDVVERLVGPRPGVVLELGCGDGGVAARLAARTRRLVVADLSLRAVLRARRRAAGAAAVVLDADAPCLAPASFDTIVAANLVDVIDRPDELIAAAAAALRPGGALVLSTPQPGLGAPDDDPAVLVAMLGRAGLDVDEVVEAAPWPRVHGPRYAQLYACWVGVARKRARRRARAAR